MEKDGWVKKFLKPRSQFLKRLTNVSALSSLRMSTKRDSSPDVGVTFGNSHFYDQRSNCAKITVEVKECPEVVRDYLQEEKGRHLWDLNILNSGPLKHVLKKWNNYIQLAYACTEVDKYLQLVTFKSEDVRPCDKDPSIVGSYILQYDILNLFQFCKDKNVYSEFDGTILYKIEGTNHGQEDTPIEKKVEQEEKKDQLMTNLKRKRINSCSQNTKLTMVLEVRDNSEIFYALRSRDQFFQSLFEFVRVVESEEFQKIFEHHAHTDSQGIDSPSYHSSPSPSSPFKLITNEAQLQPDSEIVFNDFSGKSEDSDIK